MKKIFWIICFFPLMAFAALDEVALLTPEKDCRLNYLTTHLKENWTFQIDEGACIDGFVQGFARVSLYNAKGKLTEKLQGFFVKGYWQGEFAGQGTFVARTKPEEKQQALSFVLYKEKDVSYVVQLRALQSENNSYGPFMGCPDFRLMAVVDSPYVFKNEAFQEKIATKTLELAHLYCQDLEQIALFGSLNLEAQKTDIVFQMTIDPETEEHEIIFQNIEVESLKQIIPIKNERKKNILEKSEELKMGSLAHLDILSRLSNNPQKGRVIVHIDQMNLDGSAFVDLPERIKLKNNSQLKMGWVIVQGNYYQKEMNVESVQFCKEEWCSDVQ